MYVSAQIERERVQDRRHRHQERHQHGRQRPEDEQQDDRRAEPADQSLREDAGPVRVPALGVVERIPPCHVDLDALGNGRLERLPDLACARVRAEALLAGWVDGREHRPAVFRGVGVVAVRGEERPDAEVRICGRDLADGHREVVVRPQIPVRVEDDHVRRLAARPEGLEGPLIRLVGGEARDRELLEPAARDGHGRVRAEQGQEDPRHDHEAAVAHDDVRESLEHSLEAILPWSCGRRSSSS